MPRDRLTPLPIPSRRGRVAVVTGATSGIGFQVARALGSAGAEVILAVRKSDKGTRCMDALRAEVPEGIYRLQLLDTSSLASVGEFAENFGSGRLDILVNNAGIAAPRERTVTDEGHELTLATNYLGHFALTGLLMPNLRLASRARVVTLGSLVATRGRLNFDDLELARRYNPSRAYANSKLAMVMFAREFQRRSAAADWGVYAHAAHPGFADTPMTGESRGARFGKGVAGIFRLVQSAADGAQSAVFCAASRQAVAGAYYGPVTRMGVAGPVGRAPLPKPAQDARKLTRLWEASQELTGIRFPQT